MRFFSVLTLCLAGLAGCIEPYEFLVKNKEATLVVESYISNVSFNESLNYPSDGRYFTVGLRYTSDVINIRDEVVTDATVSLENKEGDIWYYTESVSVPGDYILRDKDFKAVENQSYKLKIMLSTGVAYESGWESLPATAPPPMGNVSFEEVEKQAIEMQRDEEVIRTIKGIDVIIELPENNLKSPMYYRWDFTPHWIYIAPMAFSSDSHQKCWVTSDYYLSHYALQLDHVGNYGKNLFFIETEKNYRIYEGLSVLITQYAMSEDYYFFWDEMQQQAEKEGLFDPPPFNLSSNIVAENGEKVSGYFGVVREQAKRWYFNKDELSYFVEDRVREDCEINTGRFGPPPPCLNCLEYALGDATEVAPSWWEK